MEKEYSIIYDKKLNKLKKLHQHFQYCEIEYNKKMKRARSFEKNEKYRSLAHFYSQLVKRTIDLYYLMRNSYLKILGHVDYSTEFIRADYNYRMKEKEKRAKEFRAKHRFDVWFMQTSLSADYGSFICDKCNRNFYHSPARITLAGKTIYNCCCGYCTNEIVGQDWEKTPYH